MCRVEKTLHARCVIVGCAYTEEKKKRNYEMTRMGIEAREQNGRGAAYSLFSLPREAERVRKRAAVNEAIFQFLNN